MAVTVAVGSLDIVVVVGVDIWLVEKYFTPSPPHPVESPPVSPPESHNTDIDIPLMPRRVHEKTAMEYF
jgi:hypothetical protein